MEELNRRGFFKSTSILAITHLPVVNSLSKILGIESNEAPLPIDYAFRLTKWENLLNLEFYFINVDFKDNCLFRKRKLIALYDQEECYMIVRLPQQHIAEQSYDVSYPTPTGCAFDDSASPPKNWTAVTSISGYSYLVFRIMFPSEKDKQKIRLTEKELLDWNNSSLYKLVVRQNLNESIFEITTKNGSTEGLENNYPFQYDNDGTLIKYNRNKFPKAYGDPITALEFPWRLILSPKLPDQDRFKWNWEFSNKPININGSTEAELWVASLTMYVVKVI